MAKKSKWITVVLEPSENDHNFSEDREWFADNLVDRWKANCYLVSPTSWFPPPAGLQYGFLTGTLGGKFSKQPFFRRSVRVQSQRDLCVVMLKYCEKIIDIHGPTPKISV